MCCTTILSAQVKKTYKDQKHKHQTVVIKSSDSDDDLEILDAQFNIDNFKVGEVVKITTEKTVQINKSQPATAIDYKRKSPKIKKVKTEKSKKKNTALTQFKGRSLGGKRKDKKPKLAFTDPPKRKRGKDYSKKCYRFK